MKSPLEPGVQRSVSLLSRLAMVQGRAGTKFEVGYIGMPVFKCKQQSVAQILFITLRQDSLKTMLLMIAFVNRSNLTKVRPSIES